jgi:DNA-binding response OmpR family regulator
METENDMDGSRDVPLYRFRLGTATFDESRLELSVAGLIVDMEQKPLQVLTHLLSRVDEVCSRQELHDAVWGRRVTFSITQFENSASRSATKPESGSSLCPKSVTS